MHSRLPSNLSLHKEDVKLSSSLNAQLSFPTNPSHKGKELRFLPLKCTAVFPSNPSPHGEEVDFFTSKCIATLPTNPSPHGEGFKLSSP